MRPRIVAIVMGCAGAVGWGGRAEPRLLGKGTSLKKLLYGRTVQRLAALFVTVAALGAPKKW